MATKQAEKYKEEGNKHFKAGNHAQAIECYTYATEMDPKNPVFFTNRSNAYYMMKKYDKSERDARKAIACKETWEKGHYRLGIALMAQEKFKEAKDALETACNLKPDTATFQNALATCKASMMKGMSTADVIKQEGNEAFKTGRIEEAVGIYARAIKACKNNEKDTKIKLDCLANRAACNRQLYLPDECIADCTAALEIDPQHVKCLIRRAQAFESMEKYKAALADFNQACRIDTNAKIAFDGANRLRSSMKKMGLL